MAVTLGPGDPCTSGFCRHCTHMVHRYPCRQNTQLYKTKINKKALGKIMRSLRVLWQGESEGLNLGGDSDDPDTSKVVHHVFP